MASERLARALDVVERMPVPPLLATTQNGFMLTSNEQDLLAELLAYRLKGDPTLQVTRSSVLRKDDLLFTDRHGEALLDDAKALGVAGRLATRPARAACEKCLFLARRWPGQPSAMYGRRVPPTLAEPWLGAAPGRPPSHASPPMQGHLPSSRLWSRCKDIASGHDVASRLPPGAPCGRSSLFGPRRLLHLLGPF